MDLPPLNWLSVLQVQKADLVISLERTIPTNQNHGKIVHTSEDEFPWKLKSPTSSDSIVIFLHKHTLSH